MKPRPLCLLSLDGLTSYIAWPCACSVSSVTATHLLFSLCTHAYLWGHGHGGGAVRLGLEVQRPGQAVTVGRQRRLPPPALPLLLALSP